MAKRRHVASDHHEHESVVSEHVTRQPNRFTFRTEAQQKAWETIDLNTITFLLGSPGAGKSQIAVAYAHKAVADKRYKYIVQTRPVVEALESLGWLPGDLEHKLQPYMAPLATCASKVKIAGVETKVLPIAYMRGVTMESCVSILDEAQNCSYAQLKLYLTRLGDDAKMIICGDTDQCDIRDSGLAHIAQDLEGMEGVGVFVFRPEDSVRHPMVGKMLGRFRK